MVKIDAGLGRTPRRNTGWSKTRATVATVVLLFACSPAIAGEADVIAAKAVRAPDGTWNFEVTIRSNDKDFNYYCDRFEVISPSGGVLGVRQLEHPHADEQPFTRELRGVKIPRGIARGVLVRAHHSIRGYDGAALKVRLPD